MLFWKTLLTMFIAEMGDKTQFLLIAMAAKYKLRDILIGTAAAAVLLNGLAAGAGSMLNNILPVRFVKLAAGLAFLYFAFAAMFGKNCHDACKDGAGGVKLPFLSVFAAFFIAELGDKTQLTALAFAANEGGQNTAAVFFACTIGLFSADMIGLAIGYCLKSSLPCLFLSYLSYGIFTLFGMININRAICLFIPGRSACLTLTCAVDAVFGLLSACFFYRNHKREAQDK